MYTTKTIKADTIVEALFQKHAKDICFEELRLSSGFALQSRVDFWAINASPSTGNLAIAYALNSR